MDLAVEGCNVLAFDPYVMECIDSGEGILPLDTGRGLAKGPIALSSRLSQFTTAWTDKKAASIGRDASQYHTIGEFGVDAAAAKSVYLPH